MLSILYILLVLFYDILFLDASICVLKFHNHLLPSVLPRLWGSNNKSCICLPKASPPSVSFHVLCDMFPNLLFLSSCWSSSWVFISIIHSFHHHASVFDHSVFEVRMANLLCLEGLHSTAGQCIWKCQMHFLFLLKYGEWFFSIFHDGFVTSNVSLLKDVSRVYVNYMQSWIWKYSQIMSLIEIKRF
jgi:hypothetical protein